MYMQINHKTKQKYEGSNADSLNHIQSSQGFTSNEWLTFLQAKELGFKIKKGSKGNKIVRVLEVQDEKGKEKKRIKSFTVFNLDQCEK